MTRRPASFQELPKHDPSQTGSQRPRPESPNTPLSAQQLRAAEVAQTQAELKRELTRVYAQACNACVRKD
jgi:hypothetical protein